MIVSQAATRHAGRIALRPGETGTRRPHILPAAAADAATTIAEWAVTSATAGQAVIAVAEVGATTATTEEEEERTIVIAGTHRREGSVSEMSVAHVAV